MPKKTKPNLLRLSMLALALVALQSWGRPALPKPCDVRQPDGTVLTIQLFGDEFKHFTATTDGYTVVKAADGFYHYALLQDGRLQPSDVIARNPYRRSSNDNAFLSTIKKMQCPEMTEAQQALKNSASTLYSEKRRAPSANAAAGRIDYSKFKGLVLLVDFTDRKFLRSDANAFYQKLTNEKNFKGYYDVSGQKYTQCDGSVRDYFYDNSMGMFDPQFDVVGPLSINYKAVDAKGNDAVYTLIKAALSAANSEVDYTDYDLDKDGSVDMVYFIFAGYGSYVPGNDSSYIWPHASNLSWYSTYSGLRYDGMKFGRYACSVEIQDLESQAQYHQILDGIGTMCHEFSHVLGLADHYDTNYEEDGQANHPGTWDVMAGGADQNNGLTPVGYNAYERYSLGFAPAQKLELAGSYSLQPFNTSNQFYLLNTGTPRAKFYLENRQKTGWDKYLPSHGLLVWRVDSTNPDIWRRNEVNVNPNHQYFELIRSNPSRVSASGSDNDPFPGRNNVVDLTANTVPALLSWQGKEAVVDLFDITETDDGIITFNAGKDIYQSVSEDFEKMNVTTDDANNQAGAFCNWDLSKAVIAKVASEGYGHGNQVAKVMRSGTLTTSALNSGVRCVQFNVWSTNTQVRVALRAYTDGAWRTLKSSDGKTQVTLSRNSEESLRYSEQLPVGTQLQVQVTGTSNAMVAYVDDIVVTYSNVNDGIEEMENASPSSWNKQMYSISGQKVNAGYKGVVISNGKKFINK